MSNKIEVTVSRVAFSKENDNGGFWLILATNHGTCKGVMSWEPKENELLVLHGNYGEYQGQKEFKFTCALPNIPPDPRAQLHYVCTLVAGIGPAMEDKIWDTLAENFAKIEAGDVKGLSGQRLANFQAALEEMARNEIQVNCISFLMSKGCSFKLASAAWDRWKMDTLGNVQADCFRLAELPNFGFSHVDKGIRQNFGITDDDTRRIYAGIQYALKQLTEDGSTVTSWRELDVKARDVLQVKPQLILDATAAMLKDGALQGWKETLMLASSKNFEYEREIWEFAS